MASYFRCLIMRSCVFHESFEQLRKKTLLLSSSYVLFGVSLSQFALMQPDDDCVKSYGMCCTRVTHFLFYDRSLLKN